MPDLRLFLSLGYIPDMLDLSRYACPDLPELHRIIARQLADEPGLCIDVMLWDGTDAAGLMESVRRPEALHRLERVRDAEAYLQALSDIGPDEYDAFVLAAWTSGFMAMPQEDPDYLDQDAVPGSAFAVPFVRTEYPETILRKALPDAGPVIAVCERPGKIPDPEQHLARLRIGKAGMLAAAYPASKSCAILWPDDVPERIFQESIGKALIRAIRKGEAKT